MNYDVTVTIFRESCFTVQVTADSEVDAEDVAQQRYWDDEYDMETRNTSETVDETYIAEELCDECGSTVDGCDCDDNEEEEL